MRKKTLFQNVTLDGYFEGLGYDIGWTQPLSC